MIFIRKANLVPWYLLFLLILRHWEARRVPRRHSISSKTWCHGLSLISNNPHTRCEHFCIIFLASAPSGPNLLSITGLKVMTSGIAFDRPDRLSHLRVFPYDRFKVVSVVQVVCDRLGSVSIISSRSSEHFLRRLGRSGRSYGNQALMQWGAPYEDWRRIQARSKHKMTGGAERVAHINSPPRRPLRSLG